MAARDLSRRTLIAGGLALVLARTARAAAKPSVTVFKNPT
jgi:hypothetical protein